MSKKQWKFFNGYMTARDLSNDDDYISHILLDTVGSEKPLGVHHMRLRARLPVHNPQDVLRIIRKRIIRPSSLSSEVRCRKATNDLLALAFVAKHIKTKTAEQIDAFATHAWRYFKLYLPNGTVEIAHTARYTWRTGKTELCVLATAPIRGGEYIEELEGSMARLSPEEDADLSRSRDDGLGSRRDFSVVQVMGGNRSLLFLGPARFVNHDCNANCELERKDKVMRFKTKRAIGAGEEITAHYATDYFGKDNCECLCQTCEDAGAGGFAPKPKPESEKDVSSQEDDKISSRRTGGGPYKSAAIENDQEEAASKEGINSLDHRRHRARRLSSVGLDAPIVPRAMRSSARASLSGAVPPNTPTTEKPQKGEKDATIIPSIGGEETGVSAPQSTRSATQASATKPESSVSSRSSNLSKASLFSLNLNTKSLPSSSLSSVSSSSSESELESDEDEDILKPRRSSRMRKSTERASLGSAPRRAAPLPPPPPGAPPRPRGRPRKDTNVMDDEETTSVVSFATSRNMAPSKYPTQAMRSVSNAKGAAKKVGNSRATSGRGASSKANSATKTSGSSSSEEETNTRVLRPRRSLHATTPDISPTAPHIRHLAQLQKTSEGKAKWKGWVSLPRGTCETCFKIDSELYEIDDADSTTCARCIRHLAIFGLKWPARAGAVLAEFSDSQDSDSDAEESSAVASGDEIDSPAVTTNRSVLTRRTARSERNMKPDSWAVVSGQDPNITPLLPSKKRRSFPTDKLKSSVQAHNTDRALRTRIRDEGVLVESKVSSRGIQPTGILINLKAPASPSSESRTISTSSKTTAPPPAKRKVGLLPSSSALASKSQSAYAVNTVTAKGLTRDARARARELLRENPELDKSEVELIANAGVLRSGRSRASLPTKADDTPIKGKKRAREATSDEDLGNDQKGRITSTVHVNRRPLPLFCHGPNPSYFALRRRRLPALISHDSDDDERQRKSHSREGSGDDTRLGAYDAMTNRSRSSSLSPPPSEIEHAPPRSSFTFHSDMEIDDLFCPDPTQIVDSSTPFFVPDSLSPSTVPSLLFLKMEVDRDDSEVTLVADGGSSDQHGSTSPPSQFLEYSPISPANLDRQDFSSPPLKRQTRTYQNSKRSFVTKDSPGTESPIIGHLSAIISLANMKEKVETVQPDGR